MSDQENNSIPALVKFGADAVKSIPSVLDVIAPRRKQRVEARKRILAAITEKALTNPSSLTEADIAYVDNVLNKEEADWITWTYVEVRSEEYSNILRNSRALSAPVSQQADPSFETNLRARIREASPEDQWLLELYAQIRAGEKVAPGSFSKRTCNIVAELTAEAIFALEQIAPHVVVVGDEKSSAFIPKWLPQAVGGDMVSALDGHSIFILREYGLLTPTDNVIFHHGSSAPFILDGGARRIQIKSGSNSIKIATYPLARAGTELLQLHTGKSAIGLEQWLVDQIPKDRLASTEPVSD